MRPSLRLVIRLVTLVTLVFSIGVVADPVSGSAIAAPTFDVRDYGAVGNGSANDTPAINRAIAAANSAGGGVVDFPAGTYVAAQSIHMLSNVTLHLDANSTILGSGAGEYDPPEPNPYDAYQDFGHSHFHDAMIWGDRLTNIGFTGSGTIDGGGYFNGTKNDTQPGQADKIISLTRCENLTVSGITLLRPGHFAILLNDCSGVTSDHLTINDPDRDGWDLVNTRDVTIGHANIASNDDALAFKSDWALGETLSSGNVNVTDSVLSAGCCNGIMFGSETCGSFTNYHFSHIVITGAHKSGLGMVSMDGAHISNVHYDDITMSGIQSPIFEKIGARLRCGDDPTVGSITDIHYDNITATDAGAYTPTLWGQPDHPITGVTFHNVHLTLPGGGAAMDPNQVPSDSGGKNYDPSSIGTRPAYGFYLHDTRNITFNDVSLAREADDPRPAFIANASSDVSLHDVTVEGGTHSPFDAGFQNVDGYCVTHTTTLEGDPVRVNAPGSIGCGPAPTPASVDLAPIGTIKSGESASVSATFANQGSAEQSIHGVQLALEVPASWDVHPTTDVDFATVPPGRQVEATWQVTPPSDFFGATPVYAVASYLDSGQRHRAVLSAVQTMTVENSLVHNIVPPELADVRMAEPGTQFLIDRAFSITSLPSSLAGGVLIPGTNADKAATSPNDYLTFQVTKDATVYACFDLRGQNDWWPAWLTAEGFQLTDMVIQTSDHPYAVLAKPVTAGEVVLGPNAGYPGASSNNSYFTIVLPR